jgi:hypothetical protein
VFDALTTNIGAWWSHHFAAQPRAIVLEPVIGGRFYEDFGDGSDGALYGTVTFVKRGERLTLSGPMGMSGAVAGVISFHLTAAEDSTALRLSHQVAGVVDEETRLSYTAGWQDLLGTRLKAFVERGERYRLEP